MLWHTLANAGDSMTLATIHALPEWGEFYVVIGAAAGVLVGLMFVVIALRSETGLRSLDAMEAYATPTVVHFATVLLVSGLLTVPKQSELSLAICLAATAVAGLAYTGWVGFQAMRITEYADFLSDWVWRSALPGSGYVVLLIAVPMLFVDAEASLYIVAAASLLFLFAGIHNAWDAALWIATDQDSHGQP
jgi:hypothetical protein